MVICTKVEVKIMCGIVGYIGNEQAAPILLDGLAKLEYRGYDSAGIAVYDGTKVATLKSKGRLKVLSELSHDGATLPGTVGIGHTRWATHGSPSDVNAHPHFNKEGAYWKDFAPPFPEGNRSPHSPAASSEPHISRLWRCRRL